MIKTVGVLGGMGPSATVDFMSKVIAKTPAQCDQDHVPMLIDHNPQVPNRQAAILVDGENPSPAIAEMAKRLENAGADFLVIVCNSAHAFLEPARSVTNIPFVSIIDVTADASKGFDAVGVLATDGCLSFGGYQEALEQRGVNPVLPDATELSELMTLISRIKSGDMGGDVGTAMTKLAMALVERGAQAIIAGCTEIPLVLDGSVLGVPVIGSTDVLAEATVAGALADS